MSKMSELIWRERYALPDERSWSDTVRRVSRFVAEAELPDLRESWSTKFYELIEAKKFMPGGRILANAGRPQGNCLNCFVIGLEDSRESIGQALKEYLIISGTGGGVGLSFSKLRPKGVVIRTNGGVSSGPISFMDCIDQVAQTVKTGGSRRAATMISMSVYHPDVVEFVHHKLDLKRLTNANVSIEIDDKFLQAVRDDKTWDLTWGNKTVNTIKARDLWDKVVENALASGEPGMLNLGYSRLMSNSYYFNSLTTTNPCSEQVLPPYGSCCLGSINLSALIFDDHEGNPTFNWTEFKRTVAVAIRFLDDVLNVTTYPLDAIKEQAIKERRIGLGLMGLHHAMLKLNLRYSSAQGLEFVERVYESLRDASYLASTELAVEKGTFAAFEVEQYLQAGFVKTLPTHVRAAIRSKGMRNVCVNTQAPTGTTSIVAETSSGIEPVFAPIYVRRYNTNTGYQEETVVDPLLDTFLKEGRDVSHFEGAYDLAPETHFLIQEAAQRYLDSACSKTINLPANYSSEELSAVWLRFASQVKGTTLYRQGSRGQEPLVALSLDSYLTNQSSVDVIQSYSESLECPRGVCEL